MWDAILNAIGQGLGLAILFFPITWFAMRKQLSLNQFWDSKRGFFGAVILLPLLKSSGLMGSDESQLGEVVGLLVPICVCAILVYITRPKA